MARHYFTKFAEDVVKGETIYLDTPGIDHEAAMLALFEGAEVHRVNPSTVEDEHTDIEVSIFLPDETVTAVLTVPNDLKINGYE